MFQRLIYQHDLATVRSLGFIFCTLAEGRQLIREEFEVPFPESPFAR